MRNRVWLVVVPFAAACYTYHGVELSTIRPGTSVRAHLSAAGAQHVTQLLGPLDGDRLDGKVIENTGGVLTLETIYGHFDSRLVDNAQRHASVSLAPPDWLALDRGSVSVVRTVGLLGVIGAGVRLAYKAYQHQAGPKAF